MCSVSTKAASAIISYTTKNNTRTISTWYQLILNKINILRLASSNICVYLPRCLRCIPALVYQPTPKYIRSSSPPARSVRQWRMRVRGCGGALCQARSLTWNKNWRWWIQWAKRIREPRWKDLKLTVSRSLYAGSRRIFRIGLILGKVPHDEDLQKEEGLILLFHLPPKRKIPWRLEKVLQPLTSLTTAMNATRPASKNAELNSSLFPSLSLATC